MFWSFTATPTIAGEGCHIQYVLSWYFSKLYNVTRISHALLITQKTHICIWTFFWRVQTSVMTFSLTTQANILTRFSDLFVPNATNEKVGHTISGSLRNCWIKTMMHLISSNSAWFFHSLKVNIYYLAYETLVYPWLDLPSCIKQEKKKDKICIKMV